METTRISTSQPSANPPSVEIAYKRKCIALKKRLGEIEAENELMRARNRRGWQYIQKMRLESCILLERLAMVTGMAEEAQAGVNPELRARAASMMTSAAALNGASGEGSRDAEGGKNGPGYFEDETEGSSDEQPPTPQERPLRVKRSRKPNLPTDGEEEAGAGANDTPEATGTAAAAGSSSSNWPRLAPAPTQEDMTSSFRIQPGSNGSASGGEKETANNGYAGSDRGSQARDSPSGEPVPDPSAENNSATTPMDIDSKEPKEES